MGYLRQSTCYYPRLLAAIANAQASNDDADETTTTKTIDGKSLMERFTQLVNQGRYEEAAEQCLADKKLSFSTRPKLVYTSKAEWLAKYPAFHQQSMNRKSGPPVFGPLETVVVGVDRNRNSGGGACANNGSNRNNNKVKVYARRGRAKIMGVTVTVRETITFDANGKIVSTVIKIA